jgi:hypothetical protein
MPTTLVAAAQNPKEKLTAALKAALTTNATYLALLTPTNAQVVAQTRVLTRQLNNVMRLVAGVLDGTID